MRYVACYVMYSILSHAAPTAVSTEGSLISLFWFSGLGVNALRRKVILNASLSPFIHCQIAVGSLVKKKFSFINLNIITPPPPPPYPPYAWNSDELIHICKSKVRYLLRVMTTDRRHPNTSEFVGQRSPHPQYFGGFTPLRTECFYMHLNETCLAFVLTFMLKI